MTVAIGFDLGLDALRVAALIDDRIELVVTLPAVVGDDRDRMCVGADAQRCHPDDRVDELTTWLGRPAPDADGDPGVAGVAWPHLGGHRRSPVEVVAWLLRAGVLAVEARYGRAAGAVIAVPVDLGAVERRVLRDAAAVAGLPAARLVAAPALAGLAIADGQPARVLIVDAGAAALRVAVVEHGDGTIDLLGYAQAVGAGGRAIDRAIATQLAAEAGATRARAALELRAIARRLKEGQPVAEAGFRTPRADELELWTAPSARELDLACHAALTASAVDLAGVSRAILIGAGAQLPTLAARFRQLVGALAGPVDDAASVIARGAARAAQMFLDEPAAVMVDAIPAGFALGAHTALASMVPAGAIAPTREVRLLAPDHPDRPAVEVELWEEQAAPRFYGRYRITGLAPGSGAIAACELTVDVDRIPRLDASDLVNGAPLTVTPLLEVGLDAASIATLGAELARWVP